MKYFNHPMVDALGSCRHSNAAFYIVFGAILIFTSGGPLDSAFGRVLFAIGALFIGMGVWSFVLARRYASDDPATRPSATA